MIKKVTLIILVLLGSSFIFPQDFSQYEDLLDQLPESVRNSVLQRISTDQSFPESDSILDEEEDEEKDQEKKFSDLDRYDLLQKEFDQYGSLIPKTFGYNLFEDYKKTKTRKFTINF